MALPQPGGRWLVRRDAGMDAVEPCEVECEDEAAGIEAARRLMVETKVLREWEYLGAWPPIES
ncbi:hypothetical protein [Salininema proteolyticum]|uniref:Uncharacterized protein n=1 Tax=Salininema proteolyticum TaxID=1607685 RepID=A0ABV8TU02_9ACTN